MNRARCAIILFTLELLFVAILANGIAVAAPTIWSGLGLTFTRSTDSDSTLPQNQDRITTNVWLTRDVTQGIYNIRAESSYDKGAFQAPSGTLWATALNNPNVVDLPGNPNDGITPANWVNLTFAPWREAYGSGSSLPANLLNNKAVVKLPGASASAEDIFFDLQFTDWGVSGSGGFAYKRGVMPRTGNYNGDTQVNAADYTAWRNSLGQFVLARGTGADGDASGRIDQGDYFYWKDRYGATGSGSGTGFVGSAVPEPMSVVMFLSGLGLACVRRRAR